MRPITTALILAFLAPSILAKEFDTELKSLPKFDPLNPTDVAEFQKRDRMTARDLAAENHGSVEKAAKVYLSKLTAKDPETRGEALGDLIALARDEYLPQIQKAFREGDPVTVDEASDGIRTVIHEKLATPVFRAGLLDVLVESLERGVDQTQMRLALQLDPRKPVPTILRHDVWRKDAHDLHELLRLFVEVRAQVPLERLRELAAQLPNGSNETAWWTYAAFLECYGLVAPAEAEPLVVKALKEHPFREPNNRVEGYLAKALCTARGLVDPYHVILARSEKLGFARLSKVERAYQALMFFSLAGDISGFTAFFDRHADEMWNDLRAGMVELKETNYLKLLEAWKALFVGKKPGEPGFKFEVAEEEFEEKTGKTLTDEIDCVSKAHEFEADLDRSIHFWAAEHAAEFKAAWQASK